MRSYIYQHTRAIFIALIMVVSISSLVFFQSQGLTTIYGDSKGHLNITRRVVDSPTPGAAQLGAYWLPFMHILALPFISSDYLWHSGLAGSIPNMIAYVITSIFLFKLVHLLTKDFRTSLLSTVLFALNPNVIFMQTTPMTELVFISTFVVGVYYFISWTRSKKLGELILSASALLLGTLTRYEGWGVVAFMSFILLVDIVRKRFSKKSEAIFLIFTGLAWYGILMWIVWGWIIVHDPLDFMRNSLSAKNQTSMYYSELKSTGDHNLPLAVLTNLIAATHTSGIPLVIVFTIGFVVYLIRNRKTLIFSSTLAPIALTMPFMFDILTVFTGNVPVEVPELSKQLPPGNLFNVRYSIFLLPSMILFFGLLTKNRIIQTTIAIVVLCSYAYLLFPSYLNLVTLSESGASGTPTSVRKDINWFKSNYDGGYILASTGASDGFMFDSGIRLKNYISEGSYKLWDKSMNEPQLFIRWIITDEGNLRDAVNRKIDKKMLSRYYKRVYKDNTFQIYKRDYSM